MVVKITSAALGAEHLTELVCTFSMFDRPHQCTGGHKLVVQLVVEIGAVDLDKEGRILQLAASAQEADEERHGERLAGPGRVPDDADAFFVRRRGHFQGLGDGGLDGEELMVLGALFDHLIGSHFEDEEVPYIAQKTLFGEEPFHQGFHAAGAGPFHVDAVDGLPGRKVLPRCAPDAVQRLRSVRNHGDGVGIEELGDAVAVVANLVEGVFDGGFVAPRILELEDRQGQAVDVDHQIGAALALPGDGQLIDHQEVVGFGVVPIDGIDQAIVDGAVVPFDVQGVASGGVLVERHVAAQGVDAVRPGETTGGFVEGGGRQIGIASGQKGLQAILEDDLLRPAIELAAVDVGITLGFEALDGGELEFGFGAAAGH